MGNFFSTVYTQVASYASLHYNTQLGMQFGDIAGFTNLTLSEFFYPASPLRDVAVPRSRQEPWVKPGVVYTPRRMEMERLMARDTEVSAEPLQHGEWHWAKMKEATMKLHRKLENQERI